MEKSTKKKEAEKTHPLQKWIDENCAFVPKIKIQMTYEQCEKIVSDFKDKNMIAETLLEMDNYKPLTRRYNSVYLTLRNWLKRNINLDNNPPAGAAGSSRRRTGWTCTYQEALTWLEYKKYPLSALEDQFDKVERPNERPIWRKK